MVEYICRICGAIITKDNYKYNNILFGEENSQNKILYCPFCGVDSKYIDVNEDGKTTISIEEVNLETIGILDHAMKLEVFNGDYYKEASKICKLQKNRDVFKALSSIEYMHACIHKRYGGFKRLPELNKLNYSHYDDEKFIKIAQIREEHAVSFYEKYSKKVFDENIKLIFDALIKVEIDHIRLLQ